VVSGLVDFNDVCYDEHADLLYDLGAADVDHFGLIFQKMKFARFYVATNDHRAVHPCAAADAPLGRCGGLRGEGEQGLHRTQGKRLHVCGAGAAGGLSVSPADKSNMAKYLFGGFQRCLYPVQKFDSDAERRLALISTRRLEVFSLRKASFRSTTSSARTTPNISPISSPRPKAVSTCWSPRPETRWTIPSCRPRRNRQ